MSIANGHRIMWTKVLWVGLQSDNSTRSASEVGLKSDPQGR